MRDNTPTLKRIVSLREHDISEYERLFSSVPRFLPRERTVEEYVAKLLTLGIVFGIAAGRNLLGVVGFYANDQITKKAYLSVLSVDASVRGAGFGGMLCRAMVGECKRLGMVSIEGNVVGENKVAISFYEKNGFSVLGPGRDSYRLKIGVRVGG